MELVLLSGVAYRGRDIAGARLAGLFALLAGDLRTGSSAARLIAGLWPDELPERPAKALQVLVSRARAQHGPDLIVSTPTGYRLSLAEDQVDTSAVLLSASASARLSRAGDHAAALASAEEGLALWDGPPPADVVLDDDPLSVLRVARASTYRSLVRHRALALSRLGRHAEAVDTLTDLVQERPRDEEVLLELLRGEAATAGSGAALARYDAYRRALRDELGTDPGAPLQAEYRQLLQAAAPAMRQGVPHEPNPLLGRDRDIAAVAGLLRGSRVVSIVGPGGLGKTRLAYAVSRRAEQRIVYVVGLAGVTTEGDVSGEVAAALDVGESRHPAGHRAVGSDVLSGIASALGPAPALLVLDNCEHVIDGVAELVRALVSVTRDVRVLTTSRAPLELSSESVYLLPELDLPTSVELFEQRAAAARPGVELPADVVAELCRHLDGLPLAVELAAARVRVMSVTEIARRLEDRFSVLQGGARDVPERHRTLHAVVDWSWNLLAPAGQAAMRALSVFPGGFAADAAGHLLDTGDALPVLEHLVDQSLLKVSDSASGTRFRMLETVREFAAAQREEAAETAQVTTRFLAWAREFGMAHHESLFGPDPFGPAARIRAEQDNLVLASRYGLAQGDGAVVAATSAVLGGLWTVESNYARVATLDEETGGALARFRPEPDLVEVTRTALTLRTMYLFLTQGPRAPRFLIALRRLPPVPPDTLVRAAGVVVGAAVRDRADLQVQCDSDDLMVAGLANSIESYFRESEGDPDGALKAARLALAAMADRDTPWLRAATHARVSELCMQLDQSADALRHLTAALPVYEALGAWANVVGGWWWMVLANLQLGAVDEAERWLARTAPYPADEVVGAATYGLGVRAEILLARGDVDAGLRLWREAVDRMDRAEEPLWESWAWESKAVAVVAHARHGRLDLVGRFAGELPRRVTTKLTEPAADAPPLYLIEQPIIGALLLALATMDLDRAERTGDGDAARSGARMTALAERMRFLRSFQPTMSPVRARRAAEHADRAAYDEAVSSYAALGRDELRAAALAALRARPTGSGRG